MEIAPAKKSRLEFAAVDCSINRTESLENEEENMEDIHAEITSYRSDKISVPL
jgi:hypothetical protein